MIYMGVFESNDMAKLYTRKEVASIFKINIRTVDQWRRSGKLKGLKLARRVMRFTEEEIKALMNNG